MDFPADQLRAFAAVVDGGGFEAAARRLHVTPSAVSQRIKALERQVGTVVVQRTRPARPTPAGEVLLRLARQLELLAGEAAAELGGTPRGAGTARVPVAVVANADSLSTWFGAALRDLASEDSLAVEVLREDEAHSIDLLRSGRAMGAVTTSGQPVQGCSATRLGSLRYRAMAAPDFAARWFGQDPAADPAAGLAVAPVVHFDRSDGLQAGLLRRYAPGAHPPAHYVPDSVQFVGSIAAGLGWGLVPDLQDPGDGSLLALDPEWEVRVRLYWQRWKLDSPALDRVTAAVLDASRGLRAAAPGPGNAGTAKADPPGRHPSNPRHPERP